MQTLQQFKCPCCGGSIEFDSSAQKMKCPYCDTEFEVEALQNLDSEMNRDAPDNMDWNVKVGGEWQEDEEEKIVTYICQSCGGEIICDENTAATSCPYCDNPVVISGKLSGTLKPDYVIPFKLDKEAAKKGLLKHLSGKRLLPKVFKDQNHIDEIKGVYVPFWLYDADVDARIRYRATKVRMWSDNNYNYTDTSHFAVVRGGQIGFERVPADGSTKMADDLMESIEPFDFSEAVDFKTAYLAGYLADKYNVSAQESEERANNRIKRTTEEEFAATVHGYNNVTTESSNINLKNGLVKYALYPVWLLNTTWNGKKYTFAMNGQTGKFVGNLPVDKKAAALWGGGLSVLLGGISYAIAWVLFHFGII